MSRRRPKCSAATRDFRYRAKSWRCERRVVACIEAGPQGLDVRFVVANLTHRTGEYLYAHTLLRPRSGRKSDQLHKGQVASDRTSCRSPLANQVRLLLHTAAYWLMLGVRDAIPKSHPLAVAEFTTLRLRLIKIGASIVETATRVHLAFAAACPHRALFRALAGNLQPTGP